MLFFLQICENESLPPFIEHVFIAIRSILQTASALRGLQKNVDFSVVPQRFEVANPFNRIRDRFFIKNSSFTERYFETKTVFYKALDYFNLHFAHDLGMDFLELFVPVNMKPGLFFFKFAQHRDKRSRIAAFRKEDAVIQDRFQYRFIRILFNPETFSRPGFRKTCNCAYRAGTGFTYGSKFLPGIYADLIDFLLPYAVCQDVLHLQFPARNFHVGQAVSILIPRYFEDFGPEFRRVGRRDGIFFNTVHELFNSSQF